MKKRIKDRIYWSGLPKSFFLSLARLPTQRQVLDVIEKKTGIRPSWDAVIAQFSRIKVSLKSTQHPHVADRMTSTQKERFKQLWPDALRNVIDKEFPNHTDTQLHQIARRLGVSRNLYGTASRTGAQKNILSSAAPPKPSPDEALREIVLPEREWDDPLVLELDDDAWSKGGPRVALLSGTAYPNSGFRVGLINLAANILRREGVRFSIFNAHLIDHQALQERVTKHALELKEEYQKLRFEKGYPALRQITLKERATTDVVEAAAKALSASIPKLQRPKSDRAKGAVDFCKMYLLTTPKSKTLYDGYYGESIARRLQELRQGEIVLYKTGGDWVAVKQVDKILGVLHPHIKSRLPSRYYSTAGEKEIDEKEDQTSHPLPDVWLVNPFAAGVFTPSGIRTRPYVIGPALRRLEEVRNAENQVGIMVLDYPSRDQLLLRNYSFRDLIQGESKTIVPPRTASALQVRIIGVIQEHGGQPIGVIEDRLHNVPRSAIEREIKSLLVNETEVSERKTWPGLRYDPKSQRYDFHLPWIQERLGYKWPENLVDDRMLFFGCLHAGYTTTDYEHFVSEYPRIMLDYNINHLFGLGDMIAGMKHGLPHAGETFGGMNYSEQEVLAAELAATILFNVFKKRLEKKTAGMTLSKLSAPELIALLDECFVNFHFICGNHDLWQEQDGHTPLSLFDQTVIEILRREVISLLGRYHTQIIDVTQIVRSHVRLYPDFEAVVNLPSGIRVSMQHPHMGRAQTTSLRAQHAMGYLDCQIAGIANFHAATTVSKWLPELGQCLAIQAGTQVIYTRFERRKMKRNIDFGPIYLRVQSRNGRIFMDERGFFNKPKLEHAISKWTNPAELKTKYKLLTY